MPATRGGQQPRPTVWYWGDKKGGQIVPANKRATTPSVKTWRFFDNEFEAQMWAAANDGKYAGLTYMPNPSFDLAPLPRERNDVLDTDPSVEAAYRFTRLASASLKHTKDKR